MAALGRIGGYAGLAKYGPDAVAARARAKFLARFEDQVDPQRQLEPAERARRAEAALKAHMARLSLRASKARRQRAAKRNLDKQTAAEEPAAVNQEIPNVRTEDFRESA